MGALGRPTPMDTPMHMHMHMHSARGHARMGAHGHTHAWTQARMDTHGHACAHVHTQVVHMFRLHLHATYGIHTLTVSHGCDIYTADRAASCAGVYVWGTASSNTCPTGSTKITTDAGCQQAAGMLYYGYSSSDGRYPKGCYWYSGWFFGVYFNTHETGAAESDSTPLCASSTPGARVSAQFARHTQPQGVASRTPAQMRSAVHCKGVKRGREHFAHAAQYGPCPAERQSWLCGVA